MSEPFEERQGHTALLHVGQRVETPMDARSHVVAHRHRGRIGPLERKRVRHLLVQRLRRTLGAQFGAGDEVVVTELDHHAKVAPWTYLAKERGVTETLQQSERSTANRG